MAEDETFESQDSGASTSYPIEAGQIRKGGYIMIKERPCKVSEVTSSKTGKHGHAKCHFVAIDIFTGKKIEDLVPASHTTYAPFVKKMEYQFLDVDDDGFISCMTEDGTQREDLKIPDAMSQPPPVRCAPPPSACARLRAPRAAVRRSRPVLPGSPPTRTPPCRRRHAPRPPRPAVAAAVPPHSACDPGHRALTAPPAAPQGADELSNKIRELKEKEVDFYIVVQSACNIEQVMDTKTMTT
jgi:translation initiation factor 5A